MKTFILSCLATFLAFSGTLILAQDEESIEQTWQQRMTSQSFPYAGGSSEVVVSKNIMGGHILEHVETGRSALVKRVD